MNAVKTIQSTNIYGNVVTYRAIPMAESPKTYTATAECCGVTIKCQDWSSDPAIAINYCMRAAHDTPGFHAGQAR